MSRKLEQEVKFYLDDPKAFEENLVAMGARLKQARILETNLRFDTPDRRLSSSFQTLRLRQDKVCRLTWKGAGDPMGEVSAREEREVEVSDLDSARAILEGLGFEVMLMYEKYRSAWMLGEVEISLDEMPFGNFCEVEGPDSESIKVAAGLLGLDWEKRSTLSYLALFEIIKKNLDLKVRDLSFEVFKDIKVNPEDFGLTSD
ncbi:MAG: class IV adenylate cyclase [Anaerolineaceae bacterium]|nr:class IV adenylate cyclase [Anaerolineaceae bacterium]